MGNWELLVQLCAGRPVLVLKFSAPAAGLSLTISHVGPKQNAHLHICRPASFADKIDNPHEEVCPGGATRLEVCFLVGQLKTDHTIPEVSPGPVMNTAFDLVVTLAFSLASLIVTTPAPAVVIPVWLSRRWLSSLHSACFTESWTSLRLCCPRTRPLQQRMRSLR